MFPGGYDDWEYFLEYADEEEGLINDSSKNSILSSSSSVVGPNNLVNYPSNYVPFYQIKNEIQEKNDETMRKLLGLDKVERIDNESVETIITPAESKKIISPSSSSSSDWNLRVQEETTIDSELKLLNIYNSYPTPEDPGLVPGFWVLFPKPPVYKSDGVQKFLDSVATMNLRPINKLKKMLKTDEINLQHYGLDPRIIKPLCDALISNTSVANLILEGNNLNTDACHHLSELLEKNEIITFLNLSDCKIGEEGAKELEEGIGNSRGLEHLLLAGCELGDKGVKHVAAGVYLSDTLETLDLSNNKLQESSAEPLFKMLVKSTTLKKLILSRNLIFTKGFWEIFITGLMENESLREVDLSNNSLDDDCAEFLGKLISSFTKIHTLNLAGNLLGKKSADEIAKALMNNLNLERLCLENNPLGSAGVFEIVGSLLPKNSPSLQLKFVNLDNISPTKEILPILKEINEKRPELMIKLGKILGNFKLLGPDGRRIFLKRANFEAMSPKRKKQRKDFGQFVIQLEENIVTRENFVDAVKKFKLKLSDSLVEEIMNSFMIGKDSLDQKTLKEFYLKEYPDTKFVPPVVKEKKGKKSKENSRKIEKKLVTFSEEKQAIKN